MKEYNYFEIDGKLYKNTTHGIRFVSEGKDRYKHLIYKIDDMFNEKIYGKNDSKI